MKILLCFLSVLLHWSYSFSQGLKNDSLTEIQLKNVIGLYNNYTDGSAPIFNGRDYVYYTFKMEGHPFFGTGKISKGWLSYNGIIYALSVGYDLARNEVIIFLAHGARGIVVDNQLVDSFMIDNHTFLHLKEDHQQNLNSEGFYDLLTNGNVQLLARRTKIITENLDYNTVTRIFSSKDHFYIHKKGLYYLVSNKKEVFRLLNDNRHDLRKTMRQQHLKFHRNNFESALVKAIEIYNQLIH
jgi:hypothetical protein